MIKLNTMSSLRRSCVYCCEEIDAWTPFRIRASDISEFLRRLNSVGSNVERCWCPRCGSTDRERHLLLFLDRLRVLNSIRGGSVLHMSPEPQLGGFICSFGLKSYVKGDLSPQNKSVMKIDLQQINFPDETFDLAISNHMLEHVESRDRTTGTP